MNTLLSNFVGRLQSKHWQKLQTQTQKLDVSDREILLDFLEDHLDSSSSGRGESGSSILRDDTGNRRIAPNHTASTQNDDDDDVDVESKRAGSPSAATTDDDDDANDDDDDDGFVEDDYELLQRDLDKANSRLEELQSKHDFLQTRLQTYRSKIEAAEDFLAASHSSSNSSSSNGGENDRGSPNDERLGAMTEKIETYKRALQPVEDTYRAIANELESHQLKIRSMQDRQLELKLKTQECRVVLEELAHSGEPTPYSDQGIVAEIERNGERIDDGEAFEDERLTGDGDLENAQTDTAVDDEGNTRENGELEVADTTKNNKGSLSIPDGTRTEPE